MADEPRPSNYQRLNAFVDHLLHIVTKNEARTYMLMLRHTDNATGEVEMGNPFICSRLCTDDKSAREAIDGLERYGAIVQIRAGGGRHNVPRYFLPAVEGGIVEGSTTNTSHNTPPLIPGVYRENTGRRAPETRGAVPVNPGRHARKPRAPSPPVSSYKNTTPQIPAAPAGVGGGAGGFLQQQKFLASIGVNWTDTVRGGVEEHGWTEQDLRATWKFITNKRPQDKRQGAMVAAVRDGHKPRPSD